MSRVFAVLLLVLIANVAVFPRNAHAATFSVDTTLDAPDANPGDGVCATDASACSLRAAVEEANALPGSDEILVPSGTYTLTFGTVFLTSPTSDISIKGAGVSETVFSAAYQSAYFSINGGHTRIYDATIREGGGTGIFLANGELTLTRMLVTENSGLAGGISHEGGRLTVIDSTISGNDAGSGAGGGIFTDVADALTIVNSTISNNSAQYGGGLYIHSQSGADLQNVTIVGNVGGGVLARSTNVSMNSTVVANNSGPDCAAAAIVDLGHNADSDGTCGFIGLSAVDPLLSSLGDHGGSTPTHLPLAGSPLIDAGDNIECPFRDQRGLLRRVDGDGDAFAGCDIGSVELFGTAAPVGGIVDTIAREGPGGSPVSPLLFAASLAGVTLACLWLARRMLA